MTCVPTDAAPPEPAPALEPEPEIPGPAPSGWRHVNTRTGRRSRRSAAAVVQQQQPPEPVPPATQSWATWQREYFEVCVAEFHIDLAKSHSEPSIPALATYPARRASACTAAIQPWAVWSSLASRLCRYPVMGLCWTLLARCFFVSVNLLRCCLLYFTTPCFHLVPSLAFS